MADAPDEIMDSYPQPLAGAYYRAFASSHEPEEIYNALYTLYEAIVKYLTIVALSVYIEDGASDKVLNQKIIDGLKGLSQGDWVRLLHDILEQYSTEVGGLIGELCGFYRVKLKTGSPTVACFNEVNRILVQAGDGDGVTKQQASPEQFFERLVAYRNTIDGHGARPPHTHQQLRPHLENALRELLLNLGFLKKYRLVFLERVIATSTSTLQYRHETFTLTGLRARTKQLIRDYERKEKRVYISTEEQYSPRFDLHPLLICADCPQCHFKQTFILNKLEANRASYISYDCTHYYPLSDSAAIEAEIKLRLPVEEAKPDEEFLRRVRDNINIGRRTGVSEALINTVARTIEEQVANPISENKVNKAAGDTLLSEQEQQARPDADIGYVWNNPSTESEPYSGDAELLHEQQINEGKSGAEKEA